MLTIEITEEMIEVGAVEVADHGQGDSCGATAWAVFETMAKAAGYEVRPAETVNCDE